MPQALRGELSGRGYPPLQPTKGSGGASSASKGGGKIQAANTPSGELRRSKGEVPQVPREDNIATSMRELTS